MRQTSLFLPILTLLFSALSFANGEMSCERAFQYNRKIDLDQIDAQIQSERATRTPERDRFLKRVQSEGKLAYQDRSFIGDYANIDQMTAIEVPRAQILDQGRAGTCWMQALKNRLREKGTFSIAYWQYFDKYFRSSRSLYEAIDTLEANTDYAYDNVDVREALTPKVEDGGWSQWGDYLIETVGAVPTSVMPETPSSVDTEFVNEEIANAQTVLFERLKKKATEFRALKAKGNFTPAQRKELDQIAQAGLEWIRTDYLIPHFGDAPSPKSQKVEFLVAAKTQTTNGNLKNRDLKRLKLTPLEIKNQMIQYVPGQMIVLAHNPNRPLNEKYKVEKSGTSFGVKGKRGDGSLSQLNIEPMQMAKLALASLTDDLETAAQSGNRYAQAELDKAIYDPQTRKRIRNGQGLWFAAQIGKETLITDTIGALDTRVTLRDPSDSKKFPPALPQNESMYYNTSGANHAMYLSGAVTTFEDYQHLGMPKADVPFFFMVDNSWSEKVGFKGRLFMNLNWFVKNVYEVTVDRKYLPNDLLLLIEGKPTKIKKGGSFY